MYTNTNCKRLLDYYFVVSCSDGGKEQIKRKLKHRSLATENQTVPRFASFALKPKIVDRYPAKDYPNTPLDNEKKIKQTNKKKKRFFFFVQKKKKGGGREKRGKRNEEICRTKGGQKKHKHKHIHIYKSNTTNTQNQVEDVYVPKALAFVSHYPYFFAFDVFLRKKIGELQKKKKLRCLWHVIPKKLIRLEDLLMHYFYDIPAPAPRKKVCVFCGIALSSLLSYLIFSLTIYKFVTLSFVLAPSKQTNKTMQYTMN
ncbi:hypothetical protein RFI_00851 [Reticulomyxa filosa]|uniref:Uncharacterized protein n=1 Tax=Reticulomyxa filosa TaxID=46433 RepID=X6PDN1_RETFI|nr:hypothetical protein RFI_00851 [Reticulomyxa filosa]|eukprot:ETO36213.1 hypothetical protein RFI_00851 [Reticulomyxa filosa]